MAMAYISHEYKFVFYAAPATGSSAVIKAFSDNGIGEFLPQEDIVESGRRLAPRKHSTPAQLRSVELLDEVADYFWFVGIRNPFTWHVSKYLRNKMRRVKQIENKKSWINKLPELDRKRYSKQIRQQAKLTFSEFLEKELAGREPFDPQGHFRDGMHFFLRQENMDADFEDVKERLSLPPQITVPKFNINNELLDKQSYRDFYDVRLIDLVRTMNAPFFRRFPEYSFDGLRI